MLPVQPRRQRHALHRLRPPTFRSGRAGALPQPVPRIHSPTQWHRPRHLHLNRSQRTYVIPLVPFHARPLTQPTSCHGALHSISRNQAAEAKLADAAQTIARLEQENRQLKQRVQTLQRDNATLTAQLHLYTTARTPEELARATKAATVVQRHARGMLARRRMATYRERFAELAAIEAELARLKERRRPAIFSQSYLGENGRPRFAALEYEEAHTKLLIRIDAVASEGQDSIHARRKRLTAATNAALEELDLYRTAVPGTDHDTIAAAAVVPPVVVSGGP